MRRSRAIEGTIHLHSFATLCVVKRNKRYTMAVIRMSRSDKAPDELLHLLRLSQAVGLRLKRLYLDSGFHNSGVIAYLKQQPFAIIIPLFIGAKRVTPGLCWWDARATILPIRADESLIVSKPFPFMSYASTARAVKVAGG